MKFGDQRNACFTGSANRRRGFTLIELMIAMAILLIGIVGVAQLIPLSIKSNMQNRYDSTAVVLAERELNQMINQPLTSPQFTDIDGRVIQLGSVAATGLVGTPIQIVGTTVRVDFTGAAVFDYTANLTDPNAAIPITYEMRWTVIGRVAAGTVVSKRFLVGVWKRDPRGVTVPVTVEATVQR